METASQLLTKKMVPGKWENVEPSRVKKCTPCYTKEGQQVHKNYNLEKKAAPNDHIQMLIFAQ